MGPGTRGRRDPAGEPGPGADQSSGQVHHGDGQVQPGLQCALQRRAAHLAADGQVHEQHPGAAGLANEDHVGSGHQTEPGPAYRPIVLLLGGQMVDPLGAVVEEIQRLGGVPRDGLPDPHDQQGQDGLHPPPRNPRQVPEVAQRRLGEAGRASQGRGCTLMVLLPGLHAGLGIPGAHAEGPAPVPGKLVQGVHGGCLHPGEATRGVLHLGPGPPEAPVHATRGRKGGPSRPRT